MMYVGAGNIPRISVVHNIGGMRTGVCRTSCSTSCGCVIVRCGATHVAGRIVAMIRVRVDTGIKLVYNIQGVGSCVRGASCGARGSGAIAGCRAAHGASRVAAVVHVRADTRVNFVGTVGIMRSGVGWSSYELSVVS
jgi:hypothetical protein